ncbi:MAG: aminopeptidase P family protein [Metamycoplasmataceae bacterium]
MNRSILDEFFTQFGLDAIVSNAYQTRLWYSEIMASEGWIVMEKNKATLFVDSRYYEYAKKHSKNVEVVLNENDSFANFLKSKNFGKIAIESDYLQVTNYNKLKGFLPNAVIMNIKGQELRMNKDAQEVAKIQKAVNISLEAFEKLQPFIVEGVSEIELDNKLNYLMKRLGADKESFDSIVAFGSNSAMPHHHPTEKTLKDGDIVKIDFGSYYKGYASDITRTMIYKKNEYSNTDQKLVEILKIVEEAAKRGREAVRPGISSKEIDDICRKYITEMGYGNNFIHGTGHGVGIDIHELPSVSSKMPMILEPGMVITVEPGIYIENVGGARIEDVVLVTEAGHLVLSRK